MSRYHAYLKRAEQVIEAYTGHPPLAVFLKSFFKQHPQMGSKDRKWVSELVYAYYRCQPILPSAQTRMEQIAWAHGICNSTPDPITDMLPESIRSLVFNQSDQKVEALGYSPSRLFPWMDAVSEQIDQHTFALSLLNQPAVFLRVRPGKFMQVMKALDQAQIQATPLTDDLIQVPANSAVDKHVTLDRDAVVQDRSSAQLYTPILEQIKKHQSSQALRVWDCCAASGGKSILLTDLLAPTSLELTATDKRASILYNLQQRFHRAGIKRYTHFVKDLEQQATEGQDQYDIILADVPCTGSGTWGRTPEQLRFFDANSIPKFQQLQRSIIEHALPALKPGGWLVYSTCSIFSAENEQQVEWMNKVLNLDLQQEHYVTGYQHRADSLFVALLQK